MGRTLLTQLQKQQNTFDVWLVSATLRTRVAILWLSALMLFNKVHFLPREKQRESNLQKSGNGLVFKELQCPRFKYSHQPQHSSGNVLTFLEVCSSLYPEEQPFSSGAEIQVFGRGIETWTSGFATIIFWIIANGFKKACLVANAIIML